MEESRLHAFSRERKSGTRAGIPVVSCAVRLLSNPMGSPVIHEPSIEDIVLKIVPTFGFRLHDDGQTFLP